MEDLSKRISALEEEIKYLKSILDKNGISYLRSTVLEESSGQYGKQEETKIIFPEITAEHAKLLYSMFKGRKDVYSLRATLKNGNTAYFPECENKWKSNLCPRAEGIQIKCSECKQRVYKPLSQRALIRHLKGESSECKDVIGIYTLLPDNTCNFLVYDFDNHSSGESTEWQKEVDRFREICQNNNIDALVERSRSGRGAHIWIFFQEPIPATIAREFGSALITKGSESVDLPDFRFYDRMMPMQDSLPEGKLGNLIALPLQGRALLNGNSAFVDDKWTPYENQWSRLKNIKKLSHTEINAKISQWCIGKNSLGLLSENDKTKPWAKTSSIFDADDVEGRMEITLANGIYIKKHNLKPRLLNLLRREAAYSNPEFYKKLALGLSTYDTPRIIYKGYDTGEYICIPRGCLDALISKLNTSFIAYDIIDERQVGRSINVQFNGQLYPEQEIAAKQILNSENGILSAATAFGKTVVGAYLIAARRVNTLVLVRNTEILKNWLEDLKKFLKIYEELPEYETPTGRTKRRKELIGQLHSSINTLTGIVDVAMITSLGKAGSINPIVKNYGMVIIDECHHSAAETDESVLMEVNAKYVYGLTATPKRDDGQVKSVFFQIGPIRHKYTAKDRALKQGINHFVYPRFTRLVDLSEDKHSISEIYKLVTTNEIRNNQIIKDTLKCIEDGRTPIIMTKFIGHAEHLYKILQGKADHVFFLRGGRTSKERDDIRKAMFEVSKDESIIVVAIGKYIGEGFNFPRLDTLMLAVPISFESNVEQYAGRINRDYDGKKDVIIFDYIDQHIGKLDRMYHKRLRAYKEIGYKICNDIHTEAVPQNAIYDYLSYKRIYDEDLVNANHEIIISSPWINQWKVREIIGQITSLQEKNKSVKIHVLTLPPESNRTYVSETKEALNSLAMAGVNIHLSTNCHERFAIIDKQTVWYGSINLLAKEMEDDNIIRIESKEIAEELLTLYKQKS